MQPLVSVIVPVYNAGQYLKTAVDSILSQSLTDFELILVDDGSTDGSSSVCDQYARLDTRITVIHQKNSGICNARNTALKIAKGEYIAFCDHDDEYLPELLNDNYGFCKSHNLDFMKFCRENIILQNGIEVRKNSNIIESNLYNRNSVVKKLIYFFEHRLFSCVWDGMFNRRFLLDNNIWFDPYFKMGGEDFDFIFKCLEHVGNFGINGKLYYRHYFRKGFSTSSKINPLCMDVQRKMLTNMDNLLEKYDIMPNDIQSDYTLFYIEYYLSPQIQHIISIYNTTKERIRMLSILRKESDGYSFLASTRIPFGRSRKYSIIHFLFFHKYYRLLLSLYKYFKRDNG